MLQFFKFGQNLNSLKLTCNYFKKFVHNNAFKNGSSISELKNELELIAGIGKGCNLDLNLEKYHSSLKKYYAESQDQLPARFVKDSFLYAFIPLSSSPFLQNKYKSIKGNVRFGRLMEDADILAVAVLQKFILNPHVPKDTPSPYKVITRMVFSTEMTDHMALPHKDIKISGYVTYVGKTSSIVFVWLEQLDDKNKWNKLLEANFVLAVREFDLKNGAIANSLKAFDSRECKVMEEGRKKIEGLKMWKEQDLTKTLPNLEEQQKIHNLFMETCGYHFCYGNYLPKGKKWMQESKRSNVILSLPEDRNMYNTVFGGFIMRHAIELGTCLCTLYGSKNSQIIGMNKIDFKKPICVGSIIEMHATVVYTYNEYVQITVTADSIHKIKKDYTTNLFYLTFKLVNYNDKDLLQVVPYTYQESLMYVDGLRHFNSVMKKRQCVF